MAAAGSAARISCPRRARSSRPPLSAASPHVSRSSRTASTCRAAHRRCEPPPACVSGSRGRTAPSRTGST
eukprot:scaffold7704_cov90-Phaeocystis_antarctica.AAC.1